MGGGSQSSWQRVAPILEAIAAKYEGTPCATWLGEAGTGHFVKSVHNGIEYADMEMIAEVYGIMRDGMGMQPAEIADVFTRWNEGTLQSYLIEISGEVSRVIDPETGKPLLDIILDKAGQKGTGRWTVIEAQHLGAPIPSIEAAVAARNISARLVARKTGSDIYGEPSHEGSGFALDLLEQALIAGKVLCYAQGFDLLKAASDSFDWKLSLPDVARVWRAGCIIRSSMLNDMASAFTAEPDTNLMFASGFVPLLKDNEASLRSLVAKAAAAALPVPALSSALSYFDMMRMRRGTANMIQAQRDFFGLHSFERIDREGSHHGPWADA
jgi:6-phosphogluconate dehydrogenase